ncbi:5851_t:CDS:2, partial [Gigaspora margarita]
KLPENSSKISKKPTREQLLTCKENYQRITPNLAKKIINGNLLEAETKSSWFLTPENNSEESSSTFWSLSLIELPENYQRTAPKRRRTLKNLKQKS